MFMTINVDENSNSDSSGDGCSKAAVKELRRDAHTPRGI